VIETMSEEALKELEKIHQKAAKPDSGLIVFTQYRDTVQALLKALRKNSRRNSASTFQAGQDAPIKQVHSKHK
jgi:ERCC4-related helicase